MKCVSVVLLLITASTPLSVSSMSVESAAERGVDPVPAEETIRCEPVRVGRSQHRGIRYAGLESQRLAEARSRHGKFEDNGEFRHGFFGSYSGHRWINGDCAPLRI